MHDEQVFHLDALADLLAPSLQEHDVAANGNSSTAPLVDTTAMTSPTPEPRPWPCTGHALSWIGAATGSARYPPTTDREVWWPASSSPREARVRRGDTGCNFTAPDKVADEVEILASRDTGCNFATPHKVADWIYTSSICPTSCGFRPPMKLLAGSSKRNRLGENGFQFVAMTQARPAAVIRNFFAQVMNQKVSSRS